MTTELESFLNTTPKNVTEARRELRLHVLNEGIPSENDGTSKLRSIIWSILLKVPPMDTEDYLDLIDLGASLAYQKIRNDTFRTLASDPLFKNKVNELSIIRVLNAHAWTAVKSGTIKGRPMKEDESELPYVQGMNILAAPFLYACNSEVIAFALFNAWVTREIPLYIKSSLAGVHMGVKLLDRCLERLDNKLYTHLKSKNLAAEVYAFPCETKATAVNRTTRLTGHSSYDTLGMYTSPARSSSALGFPHRLRASHEHLVRHCANDHDSRTDHGIAVTNEPVAQVPEPEGSKDETVGNQLLAGPGRRSLRPTRKTLLGRVSHERTVANLHLGYEIVLEGRIMGWSK